MKAGKIVESGSYPELIARKGALYEPSDENDPNPPCEFQDNLNQLRQTYLLGGLPLEVLKVFAYLCAREKYQRGDYLFRQGEDDGNAFCIVSGRARLELSAGETTHALREIGPGQFLGGMTLLLGVGALIYRD